MRIFGARILIGAIVLGTLFPITAAAGLWGLALIMATGFGAVWTGRAHMGVPLVVWSTLAFYGLVTVIELVAHFWRTPFESLNGKSFVRHVIGLAFGWLAVLSLVLASVFGVTTRYVGSGWSLYLVACSILVIPTALPITLWFWVTRSRSLAVNGTHPTDPS